MPTAATARPEPAPRDEKGRYKEGKGKSRVICTELLRTGELDIKLWKADVRFTQLHTSETTILGYHLWAVPYVRLMRHSKLARTVIRSLAEWRALEVAYVMGERSAPHYRGKAVRIIGEPICWLLGLVSRSTDWRSLYAQRGQA